MTVDQLLTADVEPPAEEHPPPPASADLVRSSFALIEPRAEEVGRAFYAGLFGLAPATRAMFPVNMQVQRSRLLRALVHVVQQVDRPEVMVPFLEQLGRDHRKFGVVGEHYEAVGTALLNALRGVAGPAWTPAVHRAWSEAYAVVAGAMRTAAEAERGPAGRLGQVVGHRRIGWDIAVVTVRAEEPVPYLAGQYVSVETPQRPRLWRYLSPANAPRPDGLLEFHVRAVDGGWVSRAVVAHTAVGDVWRIGPPMGRMHLEPDTGRDLLMVAGGTGYAPVKAVIEELARRPRRPATQVFVGGRSWDDLYDLAALRELSYRHPWLDVVAVVEGDIDAGRPADGEAPAAEQGTLADVVTRYGAWADHDVLVSGSPAMIRSTVSRMLVAGTPLDRIRYDPFTMD
ncbi:globin domain-containing protein [Pseudonocardia humida]|uniref:nitric oxide dioxygenase n=1 Tax=Pseudonocardia humida TaxID=2800819 RepID=A0ABT0ZXN5_9PSEU|nr:globin domain-containing protein [Pseudonocardia humida]MCO1655384.1 flavohemoprotein [Pseudonocardia humida]